jgi:hypothetical protein
MVPNSMNLIYLTVAPNQTTTTIVPVEIEKILEFTYALYQVHRVRFGQFELDSGIDLKTPSNLNITTDVRAVTVTFNSYGFVPGYYGVTVLINDVYNSDIPQKQVDIVYKIEV